MFIRNVLYGFNKLLIKYLLSYIGKDI